MPAKWILLTGLAVAITAGGAGTGGNAHAGHVVSVTASARVIQTLVLDKLADLDLGDGAPGDPEKSVAPGDVGSASFAVHGEPNRAYTIAPFPASVSLKTGDGGPNRAFAITGIRHNAGSSPRIPASGSASFSVGAIRPALSLNQVSGIYTGTFDVTVTY